MSLLKLENNSLRLRIAPEAGASVVSFEALLGSEWLPLMRPTRPEAIARGNSSLMACFLLAPWSNRIRDARFHFNGRTIQLRPNTPEGYAHHGDVCKRPWRVRQATDRALTLAFASGDFPDINFPFPFICSAGYELDGNMLRAELTLTNAGSQAMPAGLGFHPYFQRGLAMGEEVELQFRVRGVYPELAPSGSAGSLESWQDFSRPRAIGEAGFDHCFAGWDGQATLRWPHSGMLARLVCNSALSHLVLYAPLNQPYFALEPVSHANNGFNLSAVGVEGSGVRVLEAGEELRAEFRMVIECRA